MRAMGDFQCLCNRGITVACASLILALLVALLLRSLPTATVPSTSPDHYRHEAGAKATSTTIGNNIDAKQPDLDFIPIQSNTTAPSVEIRVLPGLGGSTPVHGRWDGYAAIITLPREISTFQRQSIFTVLEPIGGCSSSFGHLSRTSVNARQNDCNIAVNGSPFNRGGGCIGQSMGDGKPVCEDCDVWEGIPSIGLSIASAKWIIGTGINYTFAESIGVENLLVGHAPGWLIRQGTVQIPSNHSDQGLAPRTAIGVTADGSRLILLVVDGCEHCPEFLGGAQGLRLHELAQEMQLLQAAFAINVDGGGSSTMFARGKGIVNYPTSLDYAPIFHERSVSTVLCVR